MKKKKENYLCTWGTFAVQKVFYVVLTNSIADGCNTNRRVLLEVMETSQLCMRVGSDMSWMVCEFDLLIPDIKYAKGVWYIRNHTKNEGGMLNLPSPII